MKQKLMAMLAKLETRKTELGKKAEASENVIELRDINTELDKLNGEIAELRSVIDGMPEDKPAAPAPEQRDAEPAIQRGASPVGAPAILGTYGLGGTNPETRDRKEEMEAAEQRGIDLKAGKLVRFGLDMFPEFRATTIGGGTLVVPTKYSNALNDVQNDISSLIDVVNAIPMDGGESYKQGFVVGYGIGDVTTETGNYTEDDPVFSYVDIVKSKITIYSEITDEARKLPNINYQSYVLKNIRQALRKKISKVIVSGAGGANVFTGIFHAPANVIPTATDLEINAIDEDTLDNIVFGFGGDEGVEDVATLILSKSDLAAFAAVRSSDGKKLYKIVTQGNTGTITSDGSFAVRYIINSACPGLAAASVGDYVMAYGYPMNYAMPIFSQVEIEESREFKFRTGQIAYRGSVWAGGNVAAYRGFLRVKKSA